MLTEKENRLSVSLQLIAEALDQQLEFLMKERVSFVLVLQADHTAQYVANVARKDGEELLQSLLDRWKANRADIPAHYNPDLK